jgi:hypothetical protein
VTRVGAAAGTAVVLAALLAALALAQWAGRDRAAFAPGGFAAVERAVAAAGLQVCDVVDDQGGQAASALRSRSYEVAAACPGDAATAVVDRFGSAADRDAAARQFESLGRPRAGGTVLTLDDTTVLLQASGDGAVRRELAAALRREGAR